MRADIERIVETYSDVLLRLAVHHVSDFSQAEDIVQEVFMKLVRYPRFFKDEEHERAWLFKVTINCCHDYQRNWWQSKRNKMPENAAMNKEYEYPLLEEVKKLPEKQRNAIYLYYYEEYSAKEIAKICSVKENTVFSWLNRGREALKKQLKGGWTDD